MGVVAIGRIRRPHGLKGEVVVNDFTEGVFAPGPGLGVVLLGPNCQTATAIETWRRKGRDAVAKFTCINDRGAAEERRGWSVAVAREAVPETPADVFYEFELIGLAVETTSGEAVGAVVETYSAGTHDVLVIEGGEGTYEVPFVRAHVADVRRGEKVVIVPYREE
ncbi:MAG: 16S rRNA processing protein RimM [candidate division Zixibacteria bacterium]|nr:16S rRNA processing protein RimM [candidate division Zixibacteria bacterium]